MEKFLDKVQLQRVLEDIKSRLAKKQNTLTGQTGQVVGFGDDGQAVPQEPPVPQNAVTTPDGAEINMEEALGPGPHTIEFIDDGKSAVQASQVSYDAAESGLEAATVQGALDELSVSVSRVSNQNMLDNADFRDPINQRGQTEYTEAGYGIDRWILTGSLKLNVSDGCIRITKTVLSNNPYFTQKFENTHYLVGKQLTVSFLYRTNITARFIANPTTSIQKTDMIPLSQD